MSDEPIKVDVLDAGRIWDVRLARPKANILDGEMVRALNSVFERAVNAPDLAVIILSGEGDNFSFGASVQEHREAEVAGMLATFHALFRTIHTASVPILSAIQGRCLGGGLELAAFSHRVYVAPNAVLGQPEIVLGVFAPVASCLLQHRCGRGTADDLCISGRNVGAQEALRIGLADEGAVDPHAAALSYARERFGPLSVSSLRLATRAARLCWADQFFHDLDRVERFYLDELMATEDAVEGIEAFVERREPHWRNR